MNRGTAVDTRLGKNSRRHSPACSGLIYDVGLGSLVSSQLTLARLYCRGLGFGLGGSNTGSSNLPKKASGTSSRTFFLAVPVAPLASPLIVTLFSIFAPTACKTSTFESKNNIMAVVAVAGGLGDLGRMIADALFDMGKYEVYVLSRKVRIRPLTASHTLSLFCRHPAVID